MKTNIKYLPILMLTLPFFSFGVRLEHDGRPAIDVKDINIDDLPEHYFTKKIPVVYHPYYKVGSGPLVALKKGAELVKQAHPFDTDKNAKIYAYLQKAFEIKENAFYQVRSKSSHEDLEKVHSKEYLESLKDTSTVERIIAFTLTASIAGLFKVEIPNKLVQRHILDPMRWQTQGTLEALRVARNPLNKLQLGINLGGGFHHAQENHGEGFCVFADIQLAMKQVWQGKPNAKILYIDLDAHQGNGVELDLQDKMKEGKLVVFDVYGTPNYPNDGDSRAVRNQIKYNNPLSVNRWNKDAQPNDTDYLAKVKQLEEIIKTEKPDIIFYNAGTDIYQKDPLGHMNISKKGIIKRDELVIQYAKDAGVPVVMTLSGGYTPESAEIIGESIENMLCKVHNFSKENMVKDLK